MDEQGASVRPPSVDAVLGPLGAAIMRVLWSAEETPVAAIVERLASRGRRPAYTTVTTILSRLRERGLVERNRRGRVAVYRANVSEAELVETTSEQAVDTVIARFGDTALRHFATRLSDLDPRRRQALIELARRHRPVRRESGQ